MGSPFPRVQLFEFNDQPWVPEPVRDLVVEALTRTLDWGRMMPGLARPFSRFLSLSGATEVLDLGSGAAGPARLLSRELRKQGARPPRFLLTDLFPRVEAWERVRAEQPETLDFVPEPVDATRIPEALSAGRARMIVNVLHHFPPSLVRAVFADAVRSGRGLFVAEGFGRNPLQFANFALAGLPALVATPLLSERQRLAKAFWLYATPAMLPVSLWDGLVSTLRVYEEEDLRPLAEELAPEWTWTWGTWPYPPLGTGTYFYGVPPK